MPHPSTDVDRLSVSHQRRSRDPSAGVVRRGSTVQQAPHVTQRTDFGDPACQRISRRAGTAGGKFQPARHAHAVQAAAAGIAATLARRAGFR